MADQDSESITVGPRTFNIAGTLGKGGFSIVKKGVDSETRKRVALKIMFVECDKDDITYQQTCHEINIMRQINNPCVIRLLGYDLHSNYQGKNCVILVQELAPHCELFDYLMHTRETFSEQLVMYVMKQLFEALGYMHAQGIAHRDLKPENLLLDKDFNIKVADFGFATYFYKREQRHTLTTELGTRGYMAPEISSHIYDEKCDSFALGVIMFICCAGFPPFRLTEDSDWWFDKIMSKQWNLFWAAHERKAKFSDNCKELIQNLLAAKPTDRITVEDAKKSNFLTNNAPHTIMDKSVYVAEMKKRYKIVRSELKKASLTERDENNLKDHVDQFDAILDEQDYLKADLLCRNAFRKQIVDAEDYDALAGALASNLGGATEAVVANTASAKKAIVEYDINDVKTAFATCTEIDQISPLLPEEFDQATLWKALNEKLLNDDVVVDQETIQQYAQLDEVKLVDVNLDFVKSCPSCYRVKYGFGTLVHLMKVFNQRHPDLSINVNHDDGMVSEPSCSVVVPVVDTIQVTDDQSVEIEGSVEVILTLKKMQDSDAPEELGNVLVFSQKGAGQFECGMEAFTSTMGQILQSVPDLLREELIFSMPKMDDNE